MTTYLQPDRTVCFVILPTVHLLDIAGAVQVFYEASRIGSTVYRIIYASPSKQILSEQGLMLGNLVPLEKTFLKQGDFIFIPGIDFKSFKEEKLKKEIGQIKNWLLTEKANGVNVGSICSGALVLAETGILDYKKCTTHWKCIDYLKKYFPKVRTQTDQLFVVDQNIYTSAGMTSGIDMSLSILEEFHGPLLPARVAREIVVYMRRNRTDHQQSIYLDYKTHFNPAIHKVQDKIISNPSKNFTLPELATISNTSVRTLTRLFKSTTGHTIVEFKNLIRIELARTLIHNPQYTHEKIASLCGFENARHLRRLWKNHYGLSLKSFKEND